VKYKAADEDICRPSKRTELLENTGRWFISRVLRESQFPKHRKPSFVTASGCLPPK